MYCILKDKKTSSYYMLPNRLEFYAFSGPDKYTLRDSSARLVETPYDDIRELWTVLYNAGFREGYLDDEKIEIKKSDVFYYDVNYNDVLYAQYLLTEDTSWVQGEGKIKKRLLYTLAKIDGNKMFFPTVINQMTEEVPAVLTYTTKERIPQKLKDAYPEYSTVKMSFNTPCIINGDIPTE